MAVLTLNALDEDVLYLFALAALNHPGALDAYSQISSRTRSASLQILFTRARVPVHSFSNGWQNGDALPLVIRPLVREFVFHQTASEIHLGLERVLSFFPSLRSVRFIATVYLKALKTCISHPNIASLSFPSCDSYTGNHSAERETTLRSPLTDLSCTPSVWRDILYQQNPWAGDIGQKVERESLQFLVPPMASQAHCLHLPLATAPLKQMAGLHWSALRDLRLSGSYLSADKLDLLPMTLADLPKRLPSLVHLHILTCALAGHGRVPILGVLSSRVHHPRLQSLILSYPDPRDAVCFIQAPNLTHLSLRDWPRYYYSLHFPGVICGEVNSAILSSSECLSILRNMSASAQLKKLELVYQADDAEDDLLCHITSAYPNLWSIELHRYRCGEDTAVPYEQIAKKLAAIRWLQRVRLNLDFPETTGPACDTYEAWSRCTAHFREVGSEIMAIFHAACPMLLTLELLRHNARGAGWARFYPAREPLILESELERDGEWPPVKKPPSMRG